MAKRKIYIEAAAHGGISLVWLLFVVSVLWQTPFWEDFIVTMSARADPVGLLLTVLSSVAFPVLFAGLVALLGMRNKYGRQSANTVVPSWAALLAAVLAMSMLTPIGAPVVTRAALATLGLGGGQKTCYTAATAMSQEARRQLHVDRDDMRAPVRVALVIGTRLFVMDTTQSDGPWARSEQAVEYPLDWFMHRRAPVRKRDAEGGSYDVCVALGTTRSWLSVKGT